MTKLGETVDRETSHNRDGEDGNGRNERKR